MTRTRDITQAEAEAEAEEYKNSEKREIGANAPAAELKAAKAKASRLPPDFWLTPERQEYALAKLPRVDALALFEEFRDYWSAKPGAGGTKLDWPATWRTWVRRAAEQRAPPKGRKTDALMAGNIAAAQRFWENANDAE